MSIAYSIAQAHTVSRLPLLSAMVAKQYLQSLFEANSSQDHDKQIEAMTAEMASLINKDVFELCPLPKCKQAIGCQWAYQTKLRVDGTVNKHKAGLVAKGYLQHKGLYYHETYAPSTRQGTICLVLSHMARKAWESR